MHHIVIPSSALALCAVLTLTACPDSTPPGPQTTDDAASDVSPDGGGDGTVADVPPDVATDADDGDATADGDTSDSGPEPGACGFLCTAVDLCDFYDVLEIGDTVEACQTACLETVGGRPWLQGIGTCVAAAAADSCDADAAQQCGEVYGGLECETLCNGSLGSCDAGDPIAGVWSDVPSCVTACEATSPDARLALAACMDYVECGDPSPCLTLSGDTAPACNGACAALDLVCGEAFAAAGGDAPEGYGAPLCAHYCTVIPALAGTGVAADASACIEAWAECPLIGGGEDHELRNMLLECIVEPLPDCTEGCADVGACGLFEPGGTNADTCPLMCTLETISNPAEIGKLFACVADADGDCGLLGTCIPGASAEPCAKQCIAERYCGGDTPIPDCITACEAALGTDDSALGELVCEGLAACGADCTSAGGTPDTGCTTACAGSSACGGYADGCAKACTGVVAAFGVSLDGDQLSCVVDHLDDSCAVAPDMNDCLQPPPTSPTPPPG